MIEEVRKMILLSGFSASKIAREANVSIHTVLGIIKHPEKDRKMSTLNTLQEYFKTHGKS